MSTYARIVDPSTYLPSATGLVAEVIRWDPEGRYPSSWVWVMCPDTTRQFALYDGRAFTNPPEPVIEPVVLVPPVPAEISDRQFFQALASEPYSLITTAEALDAVRTGAVPAVMQDIIDGMPEENRFAATMLVSGATSFERGNPLVSVFADVQGMTSAEVDQFFRFANTL